MYNTIKQYKNVLFLIVKVILSLIVIYIFTLQLQKTKWNVESLFYIWNSTYMIITVILIPFNIGLEFLKWNICIQAITKSNLKKRIYSFSAGQITGFITPNLIGNFIGRLYYFPKELRTKIISNTTLSNLAQFSSSMIFGIISIQLIGIKSDSSPFTSWIVILFLIFGLIIYFNIEKIVSILPFKWLKTKIQLKYDFHLKFRLLIISMLRHLVYSMQFTLILLAFGVEFTPNMLFWIWQVYFWSTLTPNLFMGKLSKK